MNEIRLFVCCHTQTPVPEHPLLSPIQVGAALAEREFPSFFHDNTGENISMKNRSYCELTAQYWAWKNCGAAYCGFFHYRRFLYPDVSAKKPYRVEGKPTKKLLERLGMDRLADLIPQYDLIVPKGENMYVSVREHYARAPYHHGKDLDLAEAILRGRSPEYAPAAEAYLSGTVQHFGNICIMRREVFGEYCAWLFPILEEFDRRADVSGYGPQERRVDGYLAERLLGVYYTKRRGELRTLELPRVQFCGGAEYVERSALNLLLPPASARRAAVKEMIRRCHRQKAAPCAEESGSA